MSKEGGISRKKIVLLIGMIVVLLILVSLYIYIGDIIPIILDNDTLPQNGGSGGFVLD